LAYKYVKRTSKKAKARKGESYEPKGTPPPPGEGGRFKALESALAKKGNVSNPAATAAAIGRKKYGKEEFQRMAAAGRKKKRGKKK